jgi:prepilin-type N-terminal cleavage/methylation domain-containing protein
MKKGFTLIEIILAVAILLIIASIIIKSYSQFNKNVSLKTEVGRIASLIYRAKSDTISSRGGMQYGVHFESNKVVLFQGDIYSSGASTNENFPLSQSLSISAIILTGGGSDLVFQRLTGTTATPGSITVKLDGVGGASSVLSISGNGIVTIQ